MNDKMWKNNPNIKPKLHSTIVLLKTYTGQRVTPFGEVLL